MAVFANRSVSVFALCFALLFLSTVAAAVMSRSRPGGLQEVPAAQNDIEAQDLATFAVNEHNSKQNSDLEYAGIISVHKQVVAGLMYHLKLKAASGGKVDVYEARVWIKPWENFKSLEHFQRVEKSLTPADLGTHLDGNSQPLGSRPVSSDDPAVKEAAKEALKSIQARSNSLVPYVLEEVVSAHAEVNDDHTKFNILVKVNRGPKEEQFNAEVLRTVTGSWTLKNLQQHH